MTFYSFFWDEFLCIGILSRILFFFFFLACVLGKPVPGPISPTAEALQLSLISRSGACGCLC